MSGATERYEAQRQARLQAASTYLADDPPPPSADTLWRGMTREGELRVLAVRATQSVGRICAGLGANGETGRLIAELVAGGLLVRSTLDPDAQIQLTIRNEGAAGNLYLDVWASGGGFRASVQHPDARGSIDRPLFTGGEFDLRRSRAAAPPHRSTRILGEETLSEAFLAHLMDSDQIRALLRLDVRFEGETLVHASGFLTQLTPEGGRDDIEKLLMNLESLPGLGDLMIDEDPDGRALGDLLFAGYRWDQVARESVDFVCRCSRERLVALLRQLPEDEVREMIAAEKPIETSCEFCRTRYDIEPDELQ